MSTLQDALRRNAAWRERAAKDDPGYFERLAEGQAPPVLWIGCVDSRVAPATVAGFEPGEALVHRNVANLVTPHDPNLGAVLTFAVEALEVRHVVVCGHTDCGGAAAVVRGPRPPGALGEWLRPLEARAAEHAERLRALPDEAARIDALAELNAVDGARAVARHPVVANAWSWGRGPAVHAWMCVLRDGSLRPTAFSAQTHDEVEPAHARAMETTGPDTPRA